MPVAPNVGLTAILQKRSTVNRILPNRRFEYGECVMERFRSPAVEKRARGIGDLRVVVHGDVVHVPCRKVDTVQLRMRGSIGIAVWLCDGDDAALMKIRGMVESPDRGCRYAGDDSSRLFAA